MDYALYNISLTLKPIYFVVPLCVVVATYFMPAKTVHGELNKKAAACLCGYIVFLFLRCVILRKTLSAVSIKWVPFWTYAAILNGNDMLIFQILFNIIMMVPIGFLLKLSWKRITLQQVLIFTAALELIIEINQLVFRKGLAEWDDLLHGLLGAAIGYGIPKGWEFIKKIVAALET